MNDQQAYRIVHAIEVLTLTGFASELMSGALGPGAESRSEARAELANALIAVAPGQAARDEAHDQIVAASAERRRIANPVNRFVVRPHRDGIELLQPSELGRPISKADALNLAAWIVTTVDDDDAFDRLRTAIEAV